MPMKKTFIITFTSIGIVALAWFGWSRLDRQPAALYSKQDSAYATVTLPALTPKKETKAPDLQAQALQLIQRPIQITVMMQPAEEQQAREKIEEAIKLIKDNFDYDTSWLELAGYRKLIGDYEGTIQALNFLLVIRPQNYVALHNLGDIYASYLHEYQKAEVNFLASIKSEPQNINAYIELARIYQYNNPSRKNAIEPILLQGIQANLKNTTLLVALGQYYKENGRKADAITYFEQALQLQPSNSALQQEINTLKQS